MKENDSIVADRGYGTITGSNHVIELVTHLCSSSVNLYDLKKINLI